MSSRSILIERPDGRIPGLLDVNELLTKFYGIGISFDVDYKSEPPTLQRVRIVKTRLNGEEIVVEHDQEPTIG